MVKINNLSIEFKSEVIFKKFSLEIRKGEKIAISGKSGRGKSTLLNLLAGFIPDFSGEVFIDNIRLEPGNIGEIRGLIAWLPQDTSLNFDTVSDLFYAPFGFAKNKKDIPGKDEISEIFKAFELDESLMSKGIKEISGGQKQRIILASCMLLKKPLVLLDEPTSALDENIKEKVTDYILDKKDITVLAATHDAYWVDNSDKEIKL